MTTPNHPRADRIHALFLRNARRFRDAAFVARLAYDTLDRLAAGTPEYRLARELASRARRSMEILNARSLRLARAEIALVLPSKT